MKRTNFQGVDAFLLILGVFELLVIAKVSDLPIGIINWFPKAHEISKLAIPSSNFYPAGSALMLTPFLFLESKPLLIIVFYFSLANFFFIKNTKVIKSKKLRLIGAVSFLFNPYLPWLVYSSQDTVFEYFLLMLTVWFLINKKFNYFIISGFLLNLCRPAYWIMYLLISLIYQIYFVRKKEYRYIYAIPFLILAVNSVYNYSQYNSFRLADESGITSYFSYNKYLYLSLPLFDMDVFLSKGGHMSNPYGFGESPDDYVSATKRSISENPKEILLSGMQKIDSYIFTSQKIPKLPGEYYLSKDAKSIIIGNERLSWSLVIGNMAYQFYRGILFITFLISIGRLTNIRFKKTELNTKYQLLFLILPWICGFISCSLFYTETRFKIVSELLIPIFNLKAFESSRFEKI